MRLELTVSPSTSGSGGRRVYLGSPALPIVASGSYLRHRAAARRAQREQRRYRWIRRALLGVTAAALYGIIGGDLLHLARAKRSVMSTEIRKDAQTLTKDLENLSQTSPLQGDWENMSPLAFTSAAALVDKNDPAQLDALLSSQPVETISRASFPQTPHDNTP